MKKDTKILIYFVLIAPILAKFLEWILQQYSHNGLSHLANGVWLFQILFMLGASLITFLVMDFSGKFKGQNVAYVVGISYFIKEIYNLIFVFKVLNLQTFLAIFVEPLIIMALIGFLPYNLFFKKKGGKK